MFGLKAGARVSALEAGARGRMLPGAMYHGVMNRSGVP